MWSQVLDAALSHGEREEAWDELAGIVRAPVREHWRRELGGFRAAERASDETLEAVFVEHAGSGGDLRLRVCVAAELKRRAPESFLDEEFDRDWASALLLAALREMRATLPRTYALLVMLYDDPGANEEALARKLEEPVEEVHDQLVEGRAELQQRFLDAVRATVPAPDGATAEAAHLLVHTRALFVPT